MQAILSDIAKGIVRQTYGLMTMALAITGATAYFLAENLQFMQFLSQNMWAFFAIAILQLALVLAITFLIEKVSTTTLFILFIAYAISVGLTTSLLFLIFTPASIYTTFLITAGMFAVLAIYGFFTNTDLTSLGNILIMGVVGMIIALLINLYFKNQMMDIIISFFGVIIFAGLTAYDSQKIKLIAKEADKNPSQATKISIYCALSLYLDFLNLFMSLLRFFGQKRE